jgi:hypothetical protein
LLLQLTMPPPSRLHHDLPAGRLRQRALTCCRMPRLILKDWPCSLPLSCLSACLPCSPLSGVPKTPNDGETRPYVDDVHQVRPAWQQNARQVAAECAPGGSRAGHRLEDWLHWSHARKRLSVPATCSLPTAASLLLQFQRQNASPLPFFAPHAKPSLIPPMPPALTPACSAHTRAARAPAGWLTRQPTA